MFKKVVSTMLAVSMCAAFAVPVFADESDSSEIVKISGNDTVYSQSNGGGMGGPGNTDSAVPISAVPISAVPVSADSYYTYTVTEKDTLGLLALNHYGSYAYWDELYAANADILKKTKGGQIYKGLEIVMPVVIGKDIKILPEQHVEDGEMLYTIKPGDSLAKISSIAYNKDATRVNEIIARNSDRLAANKTIYAGQTIVLPVVEAKVVAPAPVLAKNEVLYTIKKGDTLASISAANYKGDKTRAKEIITRNPSISTDKASVNLVPGSKIVLPVVYAYDPLPAPVLAANEVLYTIKKGDTLASISAAAYKGDRTRDMVIYDRNVDRLHGSPELMAGTVIVLPVVYAYDPLPAPVLAENEVLYTVKKGDTLDSIAAAAYKGDKTKNVDIYDRNVDRLHGSPELIVGTVIVLPVVDAK